jgi:membrane associated rhomboid family serine protease
MADRELVRRDVNALMVETGTRLKVVAGSLGVLWAVEIVNLLAFGGRLAALGIHPRSLLGLLGILTAPFLHASLGHLIANSIPLAVLGLLTTSRRCMDYAVVAVSSALTSGLGAWLLGGSDTVVVGASGVIFGFLGFLMGRGIFERRAGAVVLSVLVTVVFGGMLWGLLPFLVPGVSWQAHVFGFIGGLIPARILGREIRKRKGR